MFISITVSRVVVVVGGWLAGWLPGSLAAVAIESAHKLVKLPEFLTMQV